MILATSSDTEVFITYCCIRNYLKTVELEPARNTYYLMAFVGQEFGDDLPRWYWLQVSYKVLLRCWLGLQSSRA